MCGSKNKLIFFLSDYKSNNEGKIKEYKKYNDKNQIEKIVCGEQTSDAPSRYFFEYLKEKKEKIDEILCITSKRADGDGFEYYKNNIVDAFYEEKERPDVIKIEYDYDFINEKPIDENEIHKNLFENISNKVSEKDTIYIDYTSGMRDISLLIILIIKYLEYKGARFGGMIYSYNDFTNKDNCKIIDIKSMYELFDLFKGVNEFTSFGKSKALSQYYEALKETDFENYKSIANLIDTMDKFSDIMNLCILDDIDEIIDNLNKNIASVKNIKEKNKSDKLIIYMFLNLIDEIEKKFYLNERNEKITYLKLIKWCLDNELIQQALTLYVEKMPMEYFTLKLFDSDKMKDGWNDEYYKFVYTDLFNISNYNINKVNESYGENISVRYIKDIIRLNKADIISNNKSYINKYDENTRKILNEIENILKNLSSKKDIKVCNKENIIHLCNNYPNKRDKFVNYLDQQNKLIEYIIQEKTGIKPVSSKNSSENRDLLYDGKIKAIEEIKKIDKIPNWCNISIENLIILMKEYLLCKIFRNQINHATKSDLTPKVKDFFKLNGYSLDITVKNIKEIMDKAVKNIENMSLEKN